MSYAVILIPSSGVADAFKANPVMYANAIGIYLSCWFLVTALFWFVSYCFVNDCLLPTIAVPETGLQLFASVLRSWSPSVS
jgi:succinate-acetate transporter protein